MGFHVVLSISPVQTGTGAAAVDQHAAGSAATGATQPRSSKVPTWRRDVSWLHVYAGDD